MPEVTRFLLDAGVGFVQMPCPEMILLGLDRQVDPSAPRTIESEDDRVSDIMNSRSAREQCGLIARELIQQILDYQQNGFGVIGVLGMNGSPTCGVEFGWGNGFEKPGYGVLIQQLSDEAHRVGIHLSMRGIKAQVSMEAVETVKEMLGFQKRENMSEIQAKYVHTNLIAKDWRSLASFYEKLFGCVPVPPERDLSDPDLEKGTALPGAHLRGIHLRLPGFGSSRPTLEIFSYEKLKEHPETAVNQPGFSHIAFQVEDVEQARGAVLAAGGSTVGEVVTVQIATGAKVKWCYVTNP